MKKETIFILLLTSVTFSARSQSTDIYEEYGIYRNPAMVALNKISWTLTTGYGMTNYAHSLTGFYFYQDPETQLILRNDQEIPGNLFEGYQNWLNEPIPRQPVVLDDLLEIPYDFLPDPVDNPAIRSQQFFTDDTLGLSFSGLSPSVPVLASVHYDYRQFRIGGGYQFEKQWMRPLKPSAMKDLIRPYDPGFKSQVTHRFFGLAGYRFYEYWDHSFVAELQVGKVLYGEPFQNPSFSSGLYYNLGISIERHFSEYLRLVVKPSYDIKKYRITLPDASMMAHTNATFMLQIGLSYNIPEIPRSPYKSDHVQLKHVVTHPETGELMEVRGQPFWKWQNPKVGQNHRRLWRYKLRNRRKMDPY